ncbi:hypothetical protein PVAP13_1NG499200 [Panicum virgatum]|uniref:Uncharacterized protein n=1 Tax=Panicum virgatum TaxID=38727 RepID=A0A8T0X785_PANVG|nr:hypothetical protein PVAP13_1NG499200 [Panicum virgatum]
MVKIILTVLDFACNVVLHRISPSQAPAQRKEHVSIYLSLKFAPRGATACREDMTQLVNDRWRYHACTAPDHARGPRDSATARSSIAFQGRIRQASPQSCFLFQNISIC